MLHDYYDLISIAYLIVVVFLIFFEHAHRLVLKTVYYVTLLNYSDFKM